MWPSTVHPNSLCFSRFLCQTIPVTDSFLGEVLWGLCISTGSSRDTSETMRYLTGTAFNIPPDVMWHHQLACAKPGASHSEPIPLASCEGVCCPFVATSQHHCFLSPCFSRYLFSLPNTSSLSVDCRSSKNSPCLGTEGHSLSLPFKKRCCLSNQSFEVRQSSGKKNTPKNNNCNGKWHSGTNVRRCHGSLNTCMELGVLKI